MSGVYKSFPSRYAAHGPCSTLTQDTDGNLYGDTTSGGTQNKGAAVTWVSEFTVTVVAAVPLKVTLVVWVRPVPVSTTGVPTGPLAGLKLGKVGVTRNVLLLVSVVTPVVTVTFPVSAPAGTVALMKVVPLSVIEVACTPPKFTTDELLKSCPRTPIFAPSLPDVDTNLTNFPSPRSRL
jgi:hypothetical protein